MSKQEIKPCKFANGACIHCQATEQSDCEGWVCSPKRPWVGLTDEDWEKVANRKNTVLDTFEQGAVWAAYKLERRNT